MVGGGETGIRTPGTLSRSTVFKTAAFDHSATSPLRGEFMRMMRCEQVKIDENHNRDRMALALLHRSRAG